VAQPPENGVGPAFPDRAVAFSGEEVPEIPGVPLLLSYEVLCGSQIIFVSTLLRVLPGETV